MEFLIELLLEIIFEGSVEISSNKKVPKWIRYPLIVLIVLFFAVVIFGLLLLGIAIINKSLIGGLFIIVISLIMLVLSVGKFKKIYIEKKEEVRK